MTKNSLQDIIKIKVIKEEKNFQDKELQRFVKEKRNKMPQEIEYSKKDGHRGLWLVALIAIAFLFFAISFLFYGAKITINPKFQDLDLKASLSAQKNSNNNDVLSFDVVALSGEETKNVVAGEEKDYLEKAQGIVVLYNAFSSKPQNLLIDTRLEGSNGKIYKTKNKVIVPGTDKDGNPGSVEVEIYADEPGEEYNSAPIDFKIFGFKGTPKYDNSMADLKGEIRGGLKGKSKQISETDKNNTQEELRGILLAKLFKKAQDQIPAGFTLFQDAVYLNIEETNLGEISGEGSIPLTVKGTLYGFLFNEKKLTKKIVETNIEKYDGSEVYLSNIKDLSFSINNKESIDFKKVNEITFSLVGKNKIVWLFDSAKLMSEILGKDKEDFKQIISKYENISSADLIIRPAWKTAIPYKEKDVNIVVNYPQ